MKFFRRVVSKCCHLFHIKVTKCFPTYGEVLMLHWVGDDKLEAEYEPYRIPVFQFKKLVQWLSKRNTIKLENWEQEKGFYALTIDDVPENFYRNAFPILKEVGLPFTLFVNVSLIGKTGFITKEQLIEMANCEFCTIASHGIHHGEFALLNKSQALEDLLDSRQRLEEIVGKPVDMYAFPYGSYYACGYSNKYLAGKVYKYAFGTVACPITKPSLMKKYFLPRINVDMQYLEKMS